MTTTDLALDATSSSPLARLETARRLLAEVRSMDEVKAIHDFAEAARVYTRQARLGLEAQNDAAEIRLRAERKLGELLASMDKHPGGNANLSQPATGWNKPARLHDLGISKSQSSRWQAIAAVPEHVFSGRLAAGVGGRSPRRACRWLAVPHLADLGQGPRWRWHRRTRACRCAV